jgi:hypothetical protein
MRSCRSSWTDGAFAKVRKRLGAGREPAPRWTTTRPTSHLRSGARLVDGLVSRAAGQDGDGGRSTCSGDSGNKRASEVFSSVRRFSYCASSSASISASSASKRGIARAMRSRSTVSFACRRPFPLPQRSVLIASHTRTNTARPARDSQSP